LAFSLYCGYFETIAGSLCSLAAAEAVGIGDLTNPPALQAG
jgi:hypothetical protein